MSEFWEYYAMPRGHHSRSHGPFTATSNMAFMNFPLMNYVDTISRRPILFIMGEKAHSRYFTEDAYTLAQEAKELVRYQEAGKPVQALTTCDVVNIPPDTKHWHGAAKDSWFAHVAVEVSAENRSNEWFEPVSGEEYDALG